jgi:hypothetical protein
MQTGIKIGHDQQAVENISDLIRDIINAKTNDYVKAMAIEAMKETLSITGLSFQNVTIGDKTHNYYCEQDDEQDDEES